MTAKTMKLRLLLAALVALLLVSGCGYRPVALRGPLAGADGVNVTMFGNKTYRPGVEAMITRDLVDHFALRSGGKVLPRDKAELELTGTVVSYVTTPISYTALDTIKEYKTAIGVQAVLREQQSGKVVWKGDLTEEQSFPVNPDLALQQNAEEAAVAKISRRLSEHIWQNIEARF